MRTSIALVSAALLLGAALARRPADVPPPRPSRAPRVVEAAPEPESTSLFDTFLRALVPPPAPDQSLEVSARAGAEGVISEIIQLGSRRYTEAELAALEEESPEIRSIHRKLETMKIDLAFEHTAAEDVLAFIRDFSGLNIILDAASRDWIRIESPVTAKLRDVTIGRALRHVMSQLGSNFDYRVTDEGVVLLTSTLPGYPITEPIPIQTEPPVGFAAVLDATRVDLDVQNWPFSAIIDELRTRTGLDLRLHHEVEGVLSVKVGQIPLPTLLNLLLAPRNLTHTIDGVTIWIGPSRY
ncbi:MAG TPA: hypothetical protein VF950_05515 [Planctomycetota bacterium]